MIDLSADPVYAAIRKYRASVAAFNSYAALMDPLDHPIGEALFEAQDELWDVVRTTLEGFRAKIAVCWDMYDGLEKEGWKSLLDTLCKSARIMAANAETRATEKKNEPSRFD